MTTGAETKELVKDYILILYDIPEKEKKLRAKFLKDAHAMGAEKHTDSVYLLPYSEAAVQLANDLDSAGHAYVFRSQPTKEKQAIEIHTKYNENLKARCDTIEQRIVIAQEYTNAGRIALAVKMGEKTGTLLGQLAKIKENYNPPWFEERIQELWSALKGMYDDGEK